MKKTTSIILIVSMLLSTLLSLSLFAGDNEVTIGGVTYICASKYAALQKCEQNKGGKIEIPEYIEYNGKQLPVQIIGDKAFNGCGNLTAITIPDSVKTIGIGAFAGCKNLTKMEIPDSVTSIGGSAFMGCSRMTDITLSKNITQIPDSYHPYDGVGSFGGMFQNCRKLKSIIIPNGVKKIGSEAFKDCENLKTVKIPDSVTEIGDSAFYGSGITELTMPDSVTEIGGGVFAECKSLESITLSKNIKSLSSSGLLGKKEDQMHIGMFNNCSSLTKIDIPDGVTEIEPRAFYNCEALKDVTIGSGVVSIGVEAFRNTGLTSVTLPDSVTVLWSGAFAGCALSSITLSKNLTEFAYFSYSRETYYPYRHTEYISLGVFENCKNLKSISISGNNLDIGNRAFYGCSNLTDVTIGNGVNTIGGYAFCNCSNLTNIIIPESVTEIGGCAFRNCSALKSIIIPDSVTQLGGGAFAYCNDLTSVTLSKNLQYLFYDYNDDSRTYIGVFQDCTSLEFIDIKNISSIYDYVFSGCSNLKIVTGNKDFIGVGRYAFNNCSCLESVPVVSGIGEYAFNDCVSLETILLDKRNNVGQYAFKGCYALEKAFYLGTEEYFYGVNKPVDEYVPNVSIGMGNDLLTNVLIFHPTHVYDDDDDLICNECGYERDPHIPGDMNGDKEVDNKDVVTLFRYVSGGSADYDAVYDFNGDNEVNNKDVVALFREVSAAK